MRLLITNIPSIYTYFVIGFLQLFVCTKPQLILAEVSICTMYVRTGQPAGNDPSPNGTRAGSGYSPSKLIKVLLFPVLFFVSSQLSKAVHFIYRDFALSILCSVVRTLLRLWRC